jgi:hypothetical protein
MAVVWRDDLRKAIGKDAAEIVDVIIGDRLAWHLGPQRARQICGGFPGLA